ncbi:hypothetical protein [uncultured Mediterranean phage uvMED]|nr:hypothetical protein [uncultured Mediterranean phage uvMED]
MAKGDGEIEKIEWDDRKLPVEDCDWSYKNLKEAWDWLDASLRLDALFQLQLTQDNLDQTLLYQREFSVHKGHHESKRCYKQAMFEAHEIGLLTLPEYESSLYSNEPDFPYDPDEAKQKSDKSWKFNQYWYVKHITQFYNLAAYSAVFKIWRHCFTSTDILTATPIREAVHKRSAVRSDDIMLEHLLSLGRKKTAYEEEAEKAIEWLENSNALDFIWCNHKFLPRIMAEVNVRAEGCIHKNCRKSRGELIKMVSKLDEYDDPVKLTPTVISLWSRYHYLGEEYEIRGSGNRYLDMLNPAFDDAPTIDKINKEARLAEYLVAKAEEWELLFEDIKPKISKPEQTQWINRFMRIKVLDNAQKYWNGKLHTIGHPTGIYDHGKSNDVKMLADLRDNYRKIVAWQKGEIIDQLKQMHSEFQKMEETRIEAPYAPPLPPAQLPSMVKVWEAKLGEHDPDDGGQRMAEEGITEEADTTSTDMVEVSTEEIDENLKKLEQERRVKECTKMLGKFDEGLGIRQSEVMMFLGCVKQSKVGETKWVRTADGTQKAETTYPLIPKNGEDFVSNVFQHEKPNAQIKNKKKPLMAHPLYQKFLKENYKEYTKKAKTGSHVVKKSAKNQRGVPADQMAEWLLQNLPNITKQRMDFYSGKEQSE